MAMNIHTRRQKKSINNGVRNDNKLFLASFKPVMELLLSIFIIFAQNIFSNENRQNYVTKFQMFRTIRG